MSWSADSNPSNKLITIGKKHTITTMTILGASPNPNHMANKGASMIKGTVCDITKRG